MKKIFFFILIIVYSTNIAFAQHGADVATKLKEVNNDTLKHIRESIINQNQKYSGQPLEVLLKDLPHSINSYGHSPFFRPADVMQGTSLYFYNYTERQNRIAKKMNPMVIVIVWKKPITVSELEQSKMPIGGGVWDEKAINYFKNRIIEKIDIARFDF
ncbi:MAG TPA: hypothetical protein PKA77_15205 [Chitinophagaceae bacterium]|nr:hypothetical protein [Chitinophagaceae bacterium]